MCDFEKTAKDYIDMFLDDRFFIGDTLETERSITFIIYCKHRGEIIPSVGAIIVAKQSNEIVFYTIRSTIEKNIRNYFHIKNYSQYEKEIFSEEEVLSDGGPPDYFSWE